MNCKYYCDRCLGWVLNNKVIVFLSLLCFCLFVSTLALAGQKNRLSAELSDLKSTDTITTTQQPEAGENNTEGDNNTGGDSNAGGDNNAGGDSSTGGDNNAGGDSNAGGDNNAGGDSNAGGDNNAGGDSNAGGNNNADGNSNAGGNNSTGDEGTSNGESPGTESKSHPSGKKQIQEVVMNPENKPVDKPAEEQVLSESSSNFILDSKLLQMLAGGA